MWFSLLCADFSYDMIICINSEDLKYYLSFDCRLFSVKTESYSTIRSTQINLYQQFAVICRKFWIKKKNLSGQYSYLPTPSSQVLQCPCCPLQRVWIWALRKKCEVGFDYWRVPQHLDSFGWFCTVWERSYSIPLWENKNQIVSKKQWHTWELSQLKL